MCAFVNLAVSGGHIVAGPCIAAVTPPGGVFFCFALLSNLPLPPPGMAYHWAHRGCARRPPDRRRLRAQLGPAASDGSLLSHTVEEALAFDRYLDREAGYAECPTRFPGKSWPRWVESKRAIVYLPEPLRLGGSIVVARAFDVVLLWFR